MKLNQISKMNPSKINPEKVACFSSRKNDRQLTSFHQQSTTTSPPKNHVLPPRFCQNPQQKQGPTTAKKIPQKRLLLGRVLCISGDDYGGDPSRTLRSLSGQFRLRSSSRNRIAKRTACGGAHSVRSLTLPEFRWIAGPADRQERRSDRCL